MLAAIRFHMSRSMLRRFIHPPFWSKWPALGLTVYPSGNGERLIFWLSALAYSLVYFFVIAFTVVVFAHARAWTSIQEYFTTTLFDVMYRNPLLVGMFVALESLLIYGEATGDWMLRKPGSHPRS